MLDWSAQQRDDLKPCPFCGTKAVEQARISSAERAWQGPAARAEGKERE